MCKAVIPHKWVDEPPGIPCYIKWATNQRLTMVECNTYQMEWGTLMFGGPTHSNKNWCISIWMGCSMYGQRNQQSTELQLMPSNYRELMTIIQRHDSKYSSSILTDNITMVAYLSHLGGWCLTSDLAQAIWCKAHSINVTVWLKHLAGSLNCHIDNFSWLSTQYKWMLNIGIFQLLNYIRGPFTIDRLIRIIPHKTVTLVQCSISWPTSSRHKMA